MEVMPPTEVTPPAEVMPPTEVTPLMEVIKSLVSSYRSHFHLRKSFSTMKVNNYNHGSQF